VRASYPKQKLSKSKNQQTMNKLYIIIALVILSSALKAQKSKLRIDTDKFNSVSISQPIDVFLHQSDSSYVVLEGINLNADKVNTHVQNKTLYFSVDGNNNMNATVHIYTQNYRQMEFSSAVDVHNREQIKGRELDVILSGASSVKLNLDYNKLNIKSSGASSLWVYGRADSINLVAEGASDFDAYGAKNTYTNVLASGASDVSVNPDSTLIAQISGASDLKYKKDPAHKYVKTSGSSTYTQKSNSAEVVEYHGMSVEENGDTVRIDLGNGRSEIIIVDGDNGVHITRKKNRIRFRGNWAGAELGINGYMTPQGSINMPAGFEFMDLRYEKSTNFNLNFFQQSVNLWNNKLGLVTGLGFRWNNYRFDNNIILVPDSQQIYGYHNTDTARSYSKSKLMSCYLTLPVILEFQTNPYHNLRSFHIGIGVIGGVRVKTHSKQVYATLEGSKSKPKTHDDFHLQPFILDATVRIGWGPINLYGTYSIIDMFRKDQGPELRPFSVGIILPFT
jgi:hypothetical protein